jgi:hypothetical protein
MMAYPLPVGARLALTGSDFVGPSEGSGGNGAQNSPANFPLVQLLRIDNGLMTWTYPAGGSFDDTSYESQGVRGVQPGHAMLTVFVNGVRSSTVLTLITDAQALLPLAIRN